MLKSNLELNSCRHDARGTERTDASSRPTMRYKTVAVALPMLYQ